jgi:DnaK suppressor protein
MDRADLERRRRALIARQGEIAALDAAGAQARAIVTLDQQSVGRLSRMDAMQSQAMAQETHRRRRAELARIKAALALMDEGEYGWCQSCGDEIPPARLDIDPAARLCVACAR